MCLANQYHWIESSGIKWWGFKLVANGLLLFCCTAAAPRHHRHSCILSRGRCCTRACNLYCHCTALATFVTLPPHLPHSPPPHLNPMSPQHCVLSPWSTTTHYQPKAVAAAITSSGEGVFGSWRKTLNTLVAFKVDPLSLGHREPLDAYH